MLWPLYPRERTPMYIYLEAGWDTQLFWTCQVMRIFHAPTGSRIAVRSARSLLDNTSSYVGVKITLQHT
jgi:hypothetical protein